MGKKLVTHIITLTACVFFIMIHRALPNDTSHMSRDINPELVAGFIYSVIEADRTLYTQHVVERMQDTGTVMATEGWKHKNAIPLPAQMLLMSGKRTEDAGYGLKYRLASLWPIYEKNGPTSDFERRGLEAIQKAPDQPVTGIVLHDKKRYFKAIYADKGVSKACINCHNTHILSPKRDHRLGDVMGGIIISFPLE
ncbi:Tll0287-like domain-containing protein [Nitrospira sp. M1]